LELGGEGGFQFYSAQTLERKKRVGGRVTWLGECLPIGRAFSLSSLFKITEVFELLFSRKNAY
jgi:hypothetical protein